MTASMILGILILVFPFVYLFIHIGRYDGWKVAFAVYGFTALVAVFFGVGVMLLTGEIVF